MHSMSLRMLPRQRSRLSRAERERERERERESQEEGGVKHMNTDIILILDT